MTRLKHFHALNFDYKIFLLFLVCVCNDAVTPTRTLNNAVAGKGLFEKSLFNLNLADETIAIIQADSNLIINRHGKDESLEISSNSQGDIILREFSSSGKQQNYQNNLKVPETNAKAIFGIFSFQFGSFLAVITDSVDASYIGIGIREIKDIDLILIPKSTNTNVGNNKIESKEISQNDELLLLKKAFSRHEFYYSSSTYDVTRNTQSNILDSVNTTDICANYNDKFFWNENLVKPFVDAGLANWITPVTNAWTTSENLTVNGSHFSLTVVSRRSHLMQGPRFIKRGADIEGNVANFVETEQILKDHNTSFLCSFVQVRGSIPLLWSQPDTWQLRPDIIIGDDCISVGDSSLIIKPVLNKVTMPIDKNPMKVSNKNSTININHLQSPEESNDKKPKEATPVHETQIRVLKRHLVDVASHYCRHSASNTPPSPQLIILNLIDKHGTQGTLGRYFSNTLRLLSRNISQYSDQDIDRKKVTVEDHQISLEDSLPASDPRASSPTPEMLQLRYIWYDFHQQCKGGKTESLQDLMKPLQSMFGKQGSCFAMREMGIEKSHSDVANNPRLSLSQSQSQSQSQQHRYEIHNIQSGVIRTNCIDCLDRTNVAQTVIARWALQQQLHELGVAAAKEMRTDSLLDQSAERVFRHIWADNGDQLSKLYAGTKALKRDVTRYGRRTRKGAFYDGLNSAMRYYINNFRDRRRQVGLDLMLGRQTAGAAGGSVNSNSKHNDVTISTANTTAFSSPSHSILTERTHEEAGDGDGDSDGDGDKLVEDVLPLNPTTTSTTSLHYLRGQDSSFTFPASLQVMYESLERSLSDQSQEIDRLLEDLKSDFEITMGLGEGKGKGEGGSTTKGRNKQHGLLGKIGNFGRSILQETVSTTKDSLKLNSPLKSDSIEIPSTDLSNNNTLDSSLVAAAAIENQLQSNSNISTAILSKSTALVTSTGDSDSEVTVTDQHSTSIVAYLKSYRNVILTIIYIVLQLILNFALPSKKSSIFLLKLE